MVRSTAASIVSLWRRRPVASALAATLAVLLLANLVDLARLLSARGASDLFVFWSAAKFVRVFPPSQVYDPAVLNTFQVGLGMQTRMLMPFLYPPGMLLVVWPLGLLSIALAFASWVGLSLTLYLASLLSRDTWRITVLAALAAPATALCIGLGQTGFLIGGLLVAGFRVASRRPVLAGLLLGLAAVKPQFAPLIPVALVAAGLWRCLAAAVATGLVIIVLSSAAFGWSIWLSWAEALPRLAATVDGLRPFLEWRMPTVTGNLDLLGFPPSAAFAGQVAVAAFTAGGVWLAFRRGPSRAAIACLLAGFFLTTPYALPGDLPMLVAAAIMLAQERARAGSALAVVEIAALGLVFFLPNLIAALAPFPLSAAVPGLLFVTAVTSAMPAPRGIQVDPASLLSLPR